MIYSYFKTAVRNFYRHITYTVINLLGLTIGLTTAIFIFLWIMDEKSYDRHHPDAERIYSAIVNTEYSNGSIETGKSSQGPLAEALLLEIPEIEATTRTDWGSQQLLRYENKSLLQTGLWAGADILKVFNYKIISGDEKNPLPDNNSIVLTEAVATRFFGKADVIGKVFRVAEKYDMKVTAVIADQPRNTQLKFDFLLPYEIHLRDNPWMADWGNQNDLTFVKLKPNASVDEVNKKLEGFIDKKCPDCKSEVWLQSLPDSRLYSQYEDGKASGGRVEYIRIFTIVAIGILIIACINFMNLATARSATRSREVGVRKVVGAQRKGLILQFIGESILISLVAMLIALALVQLMMPLFNSLTAKNVTLPFSDPGFILSLLLIVVLTGSLAGSYPAFFLSSFRPTQVLKGNIQSTLTGASLRKILVVFQFALSVILIISSLVVFKQVRYIKTKNLGFDRSNVLTFDLRDSTKQSKDAFKTMAVQHPTVKHVTFAGQSPFSIGWTSSGVKWQGKEESVNVPFKIINTDRDFIATLDMKLIQGRNFDNELADSVNYIINEAALEIIGYKDPLGRPLNVWERPHGRIIGVVKNFHNSNFRASIDPLIIMCRPVNAWRGFIKIESTNLDQTIKHLESVHKRFDPNYPFEFRFLEDEFQEQYTLESTVEKVSFYFTFVAVFISCLGLFGLASFTAERRTKELGIRKVLGASVSNLVAMLCMDLTKLVFISLLAACPISFYLMDMFLSQYTYHTELSWEIFAISSLVMLLLSILTVTYQSTKAAITNPTVSLRSQ